MRFLFSIVICVFCVSAAQADLIVLEDFEDNVLNFTASQALFHDGSNDYFTITPLNGAADPETGSFAGFGGTHYFAAEDIDDGGTRPTNGTLSFNVNVSGFTDLYVDLLFAAGGNDGIPAYDSNDGFLVRASLDGGAFQNLLAFEAEEVAGSTTNQLLKQDADFNGTGDAAGFQPDHNFTAFNNLIIAGTGTNLLVEISIDSNDGNGEFAIDDFAIHGTNTVPEPSTFALGIIGLGFVLQRRRR